MRNIESKARAAQFDCFKFLFHSVRPATFATISAMSQQAEAEKALAQRLLDLFQGVRGRLPKNDQELHDWLASPEGKAAMAFESTSLSPWGEKDRS
jgi:hypothetical protein